MKINNLDKHSYYVISYPQRGFSLSEAEIEDGPLTLEIVQNMIKEAYDLNEFYDVPFRNEVKIVYFNGRGIYLGHWKTGVPTKTFLWKRQMEEYKMRRIRESKLKETASRISTAIHSNYASNKNDIDYVAESIFAGIFSGVDMLYQRHEREYFMSLMEKIRDHFNDNF